MLSTNNSTSLLDGPVIHYPELIIWYIVSLFISATGSIAGVALIIVIVKQHNSRDGTNPLIAQLLGVDVFILAFPNILATTEIYLTQTGHPGNINCSAVFFLQYYLTCASHFISVCLALNRVTAVLTPYYYRTCSNRTSVVLMTMFSWMVPLGFSLPFCFGVVASFTENFPLGSCGMKIKDFRLFGIITSFVTTLPLCLEGVCYGIVLIVLQCQRNQIQPQNNRSDALKQKRKKKQNMMSVVLLTCFLWYLICYLPQTLIATYMGWYFMSHWNVLLWLRTLMSAAQAGTPFILMAGNAEYRTGVFNLLRCRMAAIGRVNGSSKFPMSNNDASNGASQRAETRNSVNSLKPPKN